MSRINIQLILASLVCAVLYGPPSCRAADRILDYLFPPPRKATPVKAKAPTKNPCSFVRI